MNPAYGVHKQRLRDVVELRRAGAPVKTIATKLNLGVSTVYRWLAYAKEHGHYADSER